MARELFRQGRCCLSDEAYLKGNESSQANPEPTEGRTEPGSWKRSLKNERNDPGQEERPGSQTDGGDRRRGGHQQSDPLQLAQAGP